MITLTLPPGGVLSANQRTHWTQRATRTRMIRDMAGWAYRQAGSPKFTKAHCVCEVSYPDSRRRDVHNLFPTAKAAIDGMVSCGLLEDDSDEYLIGPDMRHAGVTPQKYTFSFTFEALS